MKAINIACTVLLTTSVFGCGRAGHLDNSTTKLIGGNHVGMDVYPASVSIWSDFGNTRQLCTGTFVSDNTLITAAHCMYGVNSSTGAARSIVKIREKGDVPSIRAFANPRANGVSPFDVAVAIFPDHTAIDWMPISTEPAPNGAEVDMVGYGSRRVWNGSDHERSHGSNLVDGEWNGLILTRRSGSTSDDVAASPGDSGGPMIHQNHVVGISSGGSGGRESYHAPVAKLENLEFLRRMVRDHGARIEGLD